MIIWTRKSAAQYCMLDDTIEWILQRQKDEPKLVVACLMGLLNTALVSIQTATQYNTFLAHVSLN